MKWGRLKFRHRLIFAVTAVTIFTLGGAFAVVARAVNASQRHQLDEALASRAESEAYAANTSGPHQLAAGPSQVGSDAMGHLSKFGAIYDATGAVLAQTENFRGPPPALHDLPRDSARAFDFWWQHDHFRGVLVPVPGVNERWLLLAAPRFDLDHDAKFLTNAMLLVFVLAVVWAVALATWVVRRLTRGHEAIAGVARRVAGGDHLARVSPQGDDEVAQLARDVNQMIDQLAMLVTTQQQFIAHAAHELRSPLTTLYGELSHALRRDRDEASYRQTIEEALDSARRLKALAEDLLALARLSATHEEQPQALALASILDAAVSETAAEAQGREVAISIVGANFRVSGWRRDLERLFRNLFENAIRHSPLRGNVRAQVAQTGDLVEITVDDEGAGVAEPDRERIFEPLYRGARELAEELPGAGLGLAIARKIARAHGGDVVLGHRAGGAQFVVRLRKA